MTLAQRLPTTRWSLVLRAGQEAQSVEIASQSLDELCRLYWPALYGYLRRRGYSRADAEDLTQGFFADLLSRQGIATADPDRGRFRAFLYASLDHYAANQRRRQKSARRGGEQHTFSLDHSRCDTSDESWIGSGLPDQNAVEPSDLFDWQWAKCLVDQTLHELREEYDRQGRG